MKLQSQVKPIQKKAQIQGPSRAIGPATQLKSKSGKMTRTFHNQASDTQAIPITHPTRTSHQAASLTSDHASKISFGSGNATANKIYQDNSSVPSY